MTQPTSVLVLAGGPDPEHPVSLESAKGIAEALNAGGSFRATVHAFEAIDGESLSRLRGDVIWPALHGKFGEGGAMQRLLETDGRPFVGSGSEASAVAIDKIETKRIAKLLAEGIGAECVAVSESVRFDADFTAAPLGFPFVVKPIFEGSTIGLFVCRDERAWLDAHEQTRRSGREAMAEPFVAGRELTIGLIDKGEGLVTLPAIEITPADERLYDYEAKYQRDDTVYTVEPDVPHQTLADMNALTLALARRIGVRDLARADFMLDDDGVAHFLEINTMPGFTSHSLVPLAYGRRGMTRLCELLVERALARASGAPATKAV